MSSIKQSIDVLTNPLRRFIGYKECLVKKKLYSLDKFDEYVDDKNNYFKNQQIDESKIFKINNNVNSVIGWVPFIKNKTSAIIYNFFSKNYSIRKNLILKIMLIKNHNIVFLKFKTLKQDEILELDKNFFNDVNINEGLLVLELIHPNIPKNHGGGQFRFWGKYLDNENNYSATVHSMPIKKLVYEKEKIYTRNYFPSDNKENNHLNFSLGFNEAKNEKKLYSLGGYNVVMDKKDNPLSIWHLGPAFNNQYLKFENTKNFQCFWVPKNKSLNPRIILDEKETLMEENEEQNLLIKIIKDKTIINEKKLKFNGYFEKSIKQIFNQNFNFEHTVYLEFYSKQFSYAQINYDNKLIGDQIHSHKANINYENENKKVVLDYGKLNNCRKFMHINLNKENYVNYLVVHNSVIKGKTTKKIKIRFFNENNFEEVKNMEINNDNIVIVYNINELFKDFVKDDNFTNAVIQLESNDYNFDATMICQNIFDDKIAVDHLTGG